MKKFFSYSYFLFMSLNILSFEYLHSLKALHKIVLYFSTKYNFCHFGKILYVCFYFIITYHFMATKKNIYLINTKKIHIKQKHKSYKRLMKKFLFDFWFFSWTITSFSFRFSISYWSIFTFETFGCSYWTFLRKDQSGNYKVSYTFK